VLCETLRGIRPHWEVLTAASPSGAQALCSVLEIDVVVIDGGMADAPELLRGLAVEQPGIGRVALAGDPPELVALAAHQVLPHAPAAYPLVRSVAAARAEAARTQVDPVERVVADLDTLPCAPLVWTRLRTMLADPDCDALHLADLIHHDVAVTAAVLRIANNPGLRRAEPATDVAEAIRLLGVRTISSALLAPQALAALRHVRPLPGLRVHEISLHGYACGVVARALLEDPQQAAQAFAAGLLQDVGRLALAMRRTGPYRSALSEAAWQERPLHEVERALLGFDHAAVGAALLRRWGLPEGVSAAVGASHQPRLASGLAGPLDVAGAVRLAHCLVTTRHPGWRDPHERGRLPSLALEADALVELYGLGDACASLGAQLTGTLAGAPSS